MSVRYFDRDLQEEVIGTITGVVQSVKNKETNIVVVISMTVHSIEANGSKGKLLTSRIFYRNNDPMVLEAYNGQNPTVNTISEAYKYLLTILPSAKSI
jgi:hypothetical protein